MKFLIGTVFYVALTLASCHQCPPPELVRPCKCTDEGGLTLQCWNLTNKSILEDITRRTGKIHFKKLYVFQSTLPLPTKFLLQKQIQSLDLVESNFTSNFLDVNHNRFSKISNLSFNSTNNNSLPNSLVKYSMQNSILYHLQPNLTVNVSLPNPILRNSPDNSTMQHSLPISTLHHLLQNSAVQLPLPNSTVHPSLPNSTVQTSLKNPKIQHSVVNSTVQHSSKHPKVDHSMTKKNAHHSKKKPLNSLTMEAVHLYDNTFTNGISWRQFLELRHLRFLLAYKVDITHLDYSFRLYVSKTLERLHLWRTDTVYLEEKVLEEFQALIDVRIQECMLTELKRSYFARPAKIQIMYFDGNQIQSLPDDIFDQMPDLRSVDLSKNHLSAVSETVFGGVYNHLGDLSLSGNPLICNCNISWIVPLQGHRYLDGYCTEPESLKERSLVTLRNGDFEFCKENVTET